MKRKPKSKKLRVRITRTYEEVFNLSADGLVEAAQFTDDPTNGLIDGGGEVCTIEIIDA